VNNTLRYYFSKLARCVAESKTQDFETPLPSFLVTKAICPVKPHPTLGPSGLNIQFSRKGYGSGWYGRGGKGHGGGYGGEGNGYGEGVRATEVEAMEFLRHWR